MAAARGCDEKKAIVDRENATGWQGPYYVYLQQSTLYDRSGEKHSTDGGYGILGSDTHDTIKPIDRNVKSR
jgi:hypothetical protein